MPTIQQPPPLTPLAAQFVKAVSDLAQRMGLTTLVIGLKDPRLPNIAYVVASPGSLEDAAMRAALADKLHLTEHFDTGWD